MRIALVAGEASGDLLGAGLIEVIRHLPRLLRIRRDLKRRFLANPPDVFIGIDAPDFNLGLERVLKRAGIRTVHYVSPSVWAWRQSRVKSVAASVDLLLTLFPFEADFYRAHQVPVHCVGHPLADAIPMRVDRDAARAALGLALDAPVVALLPGSRHSEIDMLAPDFLRAAQWLRERRPDLQFVAPMASASTRAAFDTLRGRVAPDLPVTVVEGRAREALAACDTTLIASGTATLEAMLLKRPMVVAYRLAPFTYWLLKRLVKARYIALPNLLANRELVPELIQSAVTPEALGERVLAYLDDPQRVSALTGAFDELHVMLRRDASVLAADTIASLPGA